MATFTMNFYVIYKIGHNVFIDGRWKSEDGKIPASHFHLPAFI